MNTLRVELLLVALASLFLLTGAWSGGTTGFFLALLFNTGTSRLTDRIVFSPLFLTNPPVEARIHALQQSHRT